MKPKRLNTWEIYMKDKAMYDQLELLAKSLKVKAILPKDWTVSVNTTEQRGNLILAYGHGHWQLQQFTREGLLSLTKGWIHKDTMINRMKVLAKDKDLKKATKEILK